MASHDNHRPPSELPPEPGKWPAIGLAVLVHALLLLALIFGVSWNNSSPGPVQAELWTALPAPNTPEPDQPTPDPVRPPEPIKPPPPPPPPDVQEQKQVDIAIEQDKKRREEEKRQAEQREADQRKREQQKRDDEKRVAEQRAQDKKAAEQREADKQKADKQAAEKKLAEKAAADKAEAAKKAAEQKAAAERDRKLREAFRGDTARAAGLEGGRAGGTADRNQAGGTGGDPGYAALVRSCVKPGVIYNPSGNASGGNPTAVFQVQLLPTGAQAGAPRLKSSSGVPAFDRAVENGIRRCDPFPRPASGRYEPNIELQYRMFD